MQCFYTHHGTKFSSWADDISISELQSQCAAALARVGIGRVFFGCHNNKFGGCGSLMNLHDASTVPSGEYHGYPIVEGILKDEAVRLLRSFYDRENFHAPDDKRKRKPPPTEEDVET